MANCKLQEKEMCVVIVGGNECMERRYIDLCKSYSCKAKVYTKMKAGMKDIGCPDLLVLFTSTMSHKMLALAAGQAKKKNIRVVRSHTSSMAALKNILDTHIKGGVSYAG